MRYCELRQKEVINCNDCQRIGFVADLEFDVCTGRIEMLIVPGPGRFFGCFGAINEFCIPYNCIVKIGEDIILVDIDPERALR